MCSGLHWNHAPISGPQGVRTFKSMLKNTMLQGGVCVAYMEGELLAIICVAASGRQAALSVVIVHKWAAPTWAR